MYQCHRAIIYYSSMTSASSKLFFQFCHGIKGKSIKSYPKNTSIELNESFKQNITCEKTQIFKI